MISAILGGATAIASGISAIQNFQQAKVDSQAAAAAANRLMGLQEQNKMAALQAPDISSLKSQQNAQQAATATQALQGMGPEGAANVANLYQASLQDQAQTAQDQAAMNAQVEQMKAQSAQGVESRNIANQRAVEEARLQGAQQSAADRRSAGNAAIGGIASGLGMAAEDIIAMSNPYARLSGADKAKLGID